MLVLPKSSNVGYALTWFSAMEAPQIILRRVEQFVKFSAYYFHCWDVAYRQIPNIKNELRACELYPYYPKMVKCVCVWGGGMGNQKILL